MLCVLFIISAWCSDANVNDPPNYNSITTNMSVINKTTVTWFFLESINYFPQHRERNVKIFILKPNVKKITFFTFKFRFSGLWEPTVFRYVTPCSLIVRTTSCQQLWLHLDNWGYRLLRNVITYLPKHTASRHTMPLLDTRHWFQELLIQWSSNCTPLILRY